MKKSLLKIPNIGNDSQQKTLFQLWRNNSDSNMQTTTSESLKAQPSKNKLKMSHTNTQNITIDLLDDEDEENQPPVQMASTSSNAYQKKPLSAVEELENNDTEDNDEDADDLELIRASESYNAYNCKGNTSKNVSDESGTETACGISEEAAYSTKYCDTTGFDYNSGSVWIYPNNMPIRNYQFNIIQQALHKNTMVVLPTGLGKTFIAAVVMFNFYRWYPLGKVVFMAPTKPLVNQQADACYKIVGISKEDMTQMTGQMKAENRKVLWDSKRVFFLTPQVIANDILRGTIDVNQIKCVVIDEAHKALGDYAFCKVIQSINETNQNFRVIALTATPGSDIKVILITF